MVAQTVRRRLCGQKDQAKGSQARAHGTKVNPHRHPLQKGTS
jgi:hypothetical protein